LRPAERTATPASSARTAARDLPIFDTHSHYHENVRRDVSPEEAIRRTELVGISGMLLSSWPGDGTQALYRLAPARVVPGLALYKEDSYEHPHDRYTWNTDVEIPNLIESELQKGELPYRTIGEFHLFRDEEPTPVMKQVAEIAMKHGLILHAHGHVNTMDRWLRLMGPNLKVLWAHSGITCGRRCPGGVVIPGSGMAPPAARVGQVLDAYPNLSIELSARDSMSGEPITILACPDKGKLPREWRDLILAHPDRVMLGTDPFRTERWNKMSAIADEMRGWLVDLPADVAEKVAFKNAVRLLRN
jgi:hypothetical protein